MRRFGQTTFDSVFGSVSRRERRNADLFFEELVGRGGPRSSASTRAFGRGSQGESEALDGLWSWGKTETSVHEGEAPDADQARSAFGFRGTAKERRAADLFYADLMGTPQKLRRARAEDHAERLEAEQARPPWSPGYGDRRGVDALWQHAQQQAGGLVTRCGFRKPDGVQRTEQELRDAIVAAARTESTRWHDTAGAPIFENNTSMFGHLVRYYLAVIANARPDTLVGLQAAAIASTTSYGTLPTATAAATVTSEVRRVRGVLIGAATNTTTPADLAAQVETALRRARDAHRDDGGAFRAWSAVWVCACVRGAGITLGLEAMVGATHHGRDGLLMMTTKHWEYAAEAHRRTVGAIARRETYRAFDPTLLAPEPGDIIVQDRRAAGGFTFARMPPGAMITHGDIVIEINANDVITLGGNLGSGVDHEESVRRRRFPLGNSGRLLVDATRLFAQEDNAGTLPALPAAIAAAPGEPKSTSRIFTLLKPVQECFAIPGQPYRGGVLT